MSGETVRKILLEKADVQKKAESEPKVIMCPRCQCPNKTTATLCVKCKSVLRLQEAVTISTVQKKLEDQSKTIEKMQVQMDIMLRGLVERDKQYFEKYPGLREQSKVGRKSFQ